MWAKNGIFASSTSHLTNIDFLQATGTVLSTTLASTTNLVISSLGTSAGQCLTTDSSGTVISQTCGSGASFPFTSNTNYGALANSTSTAIWFQNGLQASSTSHFVNADFIGATTSALYVSASTTIAGQLNAVGGATFGSATITSLTLAS